MDSPDRVTASIHIEAAPEVVFRYFTEPEAMVTWMGEFARLDPRPGGEFRMDIRGVAVSGQYLEVDPPRRVVVSWGHIGSEHLPPRASRVEFTLSPVEDGTRVDVLHTGLPVPLAAGHASGWRHFLARLAVAAAGGDPGVDWPEGDRAGSGASRR